jgi:DNA-binding response OmpR family regulator
MDADRQEGIITLLVVDDEPLVRMNTAEHLAEAGFRVVEAADGAQAIEALKTDDTISGVFSDIQMPGAVDGFSLRRWVEQNRPRVVVLLTSGVSNVQSAAGHLGQPRWIVFKPYDMRDVEKRLRELLSASSAAATS